MTGGGRPLLIGVVLAALLLGGCGIPDDSPVLTVGPGPSMGVSSGGELAPTQHGREDTLDKSTFVRYYLEAAAGDPDDALKRAKAFLSPSADLTFKAQSDIRVVHLVENPLNNPGSDEVTLKYQVIGTLGPNGILDPTTADGTIERSTLVVGDVPGKPGLFLQKPPQYLMISDAALGAFYDQHTIYFWNTEHTGLVPDVRYMPLTVPAEQQPTMILNWLVEGPADLLKNAVDPLPDKTAAIGNVPAVSNGKLQINLNDQAVPLDDSKALDRLRRQLQWSLRPLLPRTLELKIGHADPYDYSDSDYLTSNFAYRLADAPQRFVVFDGHVRRMAASTHASEPVPVLTAAENSHVRTAALSSSGAEDFAALVVGEAKGKESLRVGSARPGQQAPLEKIALPAPIGHPTWAVTPDQTRNDAIGLVIAKGALYSFTADGRAQPVDWPGAPGNITAVSIAPDGHRVALVAGGRLYLTVLTISGDGMQLSDPHPIRTLLLREITAVGWSSEGWLAVAGFKPTADGGRATIMDMTIDGAQGSDRVTDLGDARVTYLAAYPANPTVTSQHANSVSYVAGNAAYDALQSGLKITVGNLAEPVTNPPAGVVPTAPFFLN
jgi:hypothetical protein